MGGQPALDLLKSHLMQCDLVLHLEDRLLVAGHFELSEIDGRLSAGSLLQQTAGPVVVILGRLEVCLLLGEKPLVAGVVELQPLQLRFVFLDAGPGLLQSFPVGLRVDFDHDISRTLERLAVRENLHFCRVDAHALLEQLISGHTTGDLRGDDNRSVGPAVPKAEMIFWILADSVR